MAKFETIYVGKKTGKVPDYLKEHIGKKAKVKTTVMPGSPKIAMKIEEAKKQAVIIPEVEKVEKKIEVKAELKKETKKIEKTKEEKKDLPKKETAKKEPKKEDEEGKDKEIKDVKDLKAMFKDELIQLAKSLKVDEKGNKSELVERLAKHFKVA